MDKDAIHLDDWNRILFGEGTPLYLLEVVLRVAIVYIMILVAMRLMGKRMIAEVGRADIVSRVSLAAAVGLPIQRPNRGLLVAAVIVMIIVFVSRLFAWWSVRSKKFEASYQGRYASLVEDGVINAARLKSTRITRQEVFAALRGEGIRHLGEVERLYMEADGSFSLVKKDEAKPGLCIIPEYDHELRNRQQKSNKEVCVHCGAEWKLASAACNNCGNESMETAITHI
jgi:uncharacterized membrane protein YcaP (DUF421 family)